MPGTLLTVENQKLVLHQSSKDLDNKKWVSGSFEMNQICNFADVARLSSQPFCQQLRNRFDRKWTEHYILGILKIDQIGLIKQTTWRSQLRRCCRPMCKNQ